MGVADGAKVLLTGGLRKNTHQIRSELGGFNGCGGWPPIGTGSETYSSGGSGLLRLLSQEGQHLFYLQLLFLADVVTVCEGGAVGVSRRSRGGRQTEGFSRGAKEGKELRGGGVTRKSMKSQQDSGGEGGLSRRSGEGKRGGSWRKSQLEEEGSAGGGIVNRGEGEASRRLCCYGGLSNFLKFEWVPGLVSPQQAAGANVMAPYIPLEEDPGSSSVTVPQVCFQS